MSESAAVSESESSSMSDSVSMSESASMSTSTSQSMSESASTSASESASASAANSSASQGSNAGNGSGSGSGASSSASESGPVAKVTGETTEISFNEVADNAETANTITFNEVEVAIEDQEVSLAVVLDDEAAKVDDIVVIGEEETPLAMAKSGVSGRVWWYWILIIISAISGKIAKDKRKSKADEVSDK